ncbi:amidase domain-containing protein [Lentzea indica]|uniref:amidase domain-containing protein n=1 Tax=Lentzea indica TaxID=2604800 RepID=UPI001CB752F0|nr:amidase domain-containing protein [Lentzea indica]
MNAFVVERRGFRLRRNVFFGVAVFVSVVLTAGGTGASADTGKISARDRKQIAEISQTYLQHRADRVTSRPQIEGFGVRMTDELTADLKEDVAELAARRDDYREIHGGYSRAQVETVVEQVSSAGDGTTALARAKERTRLYYHTPKPGTETSSGHELQHKLTVRRSGGSWVLSGVEALLGSGPAPATQMRKAPPTSHWKTAEPATYKQPASAVKPAHGSRDEKVMAAAYFYQAMVNYAYKWGKNANPNFRTYDQDCTNFLSQIMMAGGWEDVDGDRTSNSSWYLGTFTWTTSYTWAAAENWYWFASQHSGRTRLLTNVYDLAIADVLQANWDPWNNTVIDHSMFVTKVQGGERFLTYHTENKVDVPLAELLRNNPNTFWYAHRT